MNWVASGVSGIALAVYLDPVNDLVERFSWVMMAATVSLGIQNVLLDISTWWLIQTLVAVLCVRRRNAAQRFLPLLPN
jgi:hypothetical protein